MRDGSAVLTHPADLGIVPDDPTFAADPYPAYARVREASAVHHPEGHHLRYLTRYDDVHAAFRDRRLGTTFLHRYTPEELGLRPGIPVWRDPRWTEFQAFERWELLNLEPPAHTRLRRLVTQAFTPRATEAMRGSLEERARDLLAPGRACGQVDLVTECAEPFSLGVICDLIGVPAPDRTTVKQLSDATVGMYEPGASEARQERANAAAGMFRRYLLETTAHRRRVPADDLLTSLLDATVDGERLSDDQIASTAMVLLMAGHEAVVNATANGVALLARHPGQWALLREGRVTVRDAVEEILRYDPPLQWFERWVLDDGVEVDGVPIPKGARVALVLAAANRDPRRFPDPDRFDVTRGDAGHLSFGGGIHFCLGAPLARLELETVLAELLRTEATLTLAAEPVRRPTFQFRGLASLVLRLSPGGAT